MNCFSPSVLYAGILQSRLRGLYDDESRISASLRYGPAISTRFDYVGAQEVVDSFGDRTFDDSADDAHAFRNSLWNLIDLIRPSWRRVIPLGRGAVFKLLDEDAIQSFHIALLTQTPPDLECARWWSNLDAVVRFEEVTSQEDRWRDAEFRTLVNERLRLTGTGLEPTWVSIDNNSAGYDIGSWTISNDCHTPRPKFIEVKSSNSRPRFFISRNEWAFARRHSKTWELQLWMSEIADPIVLDISQIEPHVAIDQGRGRWESLQIEIGE